MIIKTIRNYEMKKHKHQRLVEKNKHKFDKNKFKKTPSRGDPWNFTSILGLSATFELKIPNFIVEMDYIDTLIKKMGSSEASSKS